MSDKKPIPMPCDGYAVLQIIQPEVSGLVLPEGLSDDTKAEMETHVMAVNSGRHVVGAAWVESKIQPGDTCILAPRTVRAHSQEMPEGYCLVRLMDIAGWVPKGMGAVRQ